MVLHLSEWGSRMALKYNPSFSRQDPLTRAKGRGSGKTGTHHWLTQQYLSVALIPLVLYSLGSFIYQVLLGQGYEDAVAWLRFGPNALFLLLMIFVGIWHGANGILGIIEDYVHDPAYNLLAVIAVRATAVIIALSSLLAIIKVFVGA